MHNRCTIHYEKTEKGRLAVCIEGIMRKMVERRGLKVQYFKLGAPHLIEEC